MTDLEIQSSLEIDTMQVVDYWLLFLYFKSKTVKINKSQLGTIIAYFTLSYVLIFLLCTVCII
jgi:hypothetical protein